jgi:hypothetical protein
MAEIINSSNRFRKIDLCFKNKDIYVVFEQPVDMFYWYRIFLKPTGRYVALKNMDNKKGWTFIASVNLSELFPGMVI